MMECLEMAHVVMAWLMDQDRRFLDGVLGAGTATAKNVSLLDSLWNEITERGIELTVENKIRLFQDFLDD